MSKICFELDCPDGTEIAIGNFFKLSKFVVLLSEDGQSKFIVKEVEL